jgi:hypothetical protein
MYKTGSRLRIRVRIRVSA